jgi:hypothetical protein
MTVCKVLLFGLKPCDISSSTNDKISETSLERQHALIPTTSSQSQLENLSSSSDIDYLTIDIKPLLTPISSVRNDENAFFFLILLFFFSVLQQAVIPVMNQVQFM